MARSYHWRASGLRERQGAWGGLLREGETTMLLLTREDIRRALPMAGAMEAVASAFAQLADGQAQVPLRSRVEAPAHEGVGLFMPADLAGSDALRLQTLTLFPHQPDGS